MDRLPGIQIPISSSVIDVASPALESHCCPLSIPDSANSLMSFPDRPPKTLVLAAMLIPVLFGIAWLLPRPAKPIEVLPVTSTFPASTLPLTMSDVGPASKAPARICNVQVVDFNRDSRADLLVCDALRHCVLWYEQTADADWKEHVLGDRLIAPAHATVVDLDSDQDPDIVVSVLGGMLPTDATIGQVVWLENQDWQFIPHVLLEDVRRVADVQAGDLDDDGDPDLAVAVFGYSIGRILWLENLGDGSFLDHELENAAGTIHVPLADYDADGDLDIAAGVSQDEEVVKIFENLGAGKFTPRTVFLNHNFDLGSAGLVMDDLDQDGDPDLILPAGDNLEYEFSFPQPYHGCFWIENLGNWKFRPRRIATFGGAYAAAAGDLDADGDRDVVLVSLVNEWQNPHHPAVVWLENDGHQEFTAHRIAERPTHLATVDCGDINGDGRDDIVAGALKILEPLVDREGSVVTWLSGVSVD